MQSLLNGSDARAALFAGGLSLALLLGAWTFQYGFGYAPCIVCYWQRYAHMGVIALAAAVLLLRGVAPLPPRFAAGLLVIALLGSAALAGYHVGVEFGWWEGPQVCAADEAAELPPIDPNDPFAVLDGDIKGPACSEVVWSFLGLSMAGWNMVISLLGAAGAAYLGLFDRRAK